MNPGRKGIVSYFLHKFILGACLLPVHIYSQLPDLKLSFNAKNKTVTQILEEITLHSGYYFTYDPTIVHGKKKVSINVKDLLLENVLDTLLQNPGLKYRFIDKNIIIHPKGTAVTVLSDSLQIKSHQIQGIITDRSTGKPLSFANVALFGTAKGTISNLSGEFILNIPAGIDEPVLVISFVGYRNFYHSVILNSIEEIHVEMDKDFVSLQEVIIRIKDPVAILNESLKKIADNYISEYSIMTGYYREYVRKNKDLMNFTEAVIEISKEPYTHQYSNEKVMILKGRKIINSDVSDTILMKIKSGIYSCLELDIVKNLPDFLSGDFLKLYDYEFSDVVSYKNGLQYLISFRQKGMIEEALYKGTLLLDQKTLALQAADFEINPEKINRESNMFIVRKSKSVKVRPVNATYHIEYRQTNNKFHLSQVQAGVTFKLRNRKEWISSLYQMRIELVITDINPGIIMKFPDEAKLRPGAIISDQGFDYDPSFWGSYDFIEPEPSIKDALMRIGISIEELGNR